MPETNTATSPERLEQDASVDLIAVTRSLWLERKTLLIAALAFGLLGASLAVILSKYKSEGLYQLHVPSMRAAETGAALAIGMPSFSEYKLISSLVSEPDRMREYMAVKGVSADDDLVGLPRALATPELQRQLFSPIYTYTKADSKEFVDSPNAKETAGQLLGVRISSEAKSAEAAQKRANFLAQYLRDAVFFQALSDYIRIRNNELQRSALSFENSVISGKYNLKLVTEKMRELRGISQRNPEAGRGDARSVVSLSDSTVRFLPLPTQIVATEVGIFDANTSMERARREREQTEYTIAYYAALQQAATKAKTAEEIIKAMPDAKVAADKGRDLTDEKIKLVANNTQLEILSLQDAFYSRSRFVSGPTLPERGFTMLALSALVGLMLGALFAAAYVLLRNWWRLNSSKFAASAA